MCNTQAIYAQIIQDTGQIFIEISNIISTMPGHSGNDYNDPSVSQLNSWENLLDNVFEDDYVQADSIADSLGYEVIHFTDTTEYVDKTYYVLKSTGSNYWGTYVYYPDFCRPLVIQVPHPLKEINTGQQGIHVFQRTDALFFCLSGTSRCNHSSFTNCDGATTICSGTAERYRISDMAHSVSAIFQKTTEKLQNSFSNTFFVQLHGFAKLVSDPYLILSNGTQLTPERDYSVLLKNNLLIEDTSLTFKIAHIDLEWTRLRAFDNTQGRLINSSIDPCYFYATTTNGRFLSIEQERTKLRDDVTGWNKMANALINTFVCYPFVWHGSMDTDWNTAANWRGNVVPASTDNVTIADKSNKPVINEEPGLPALCNNLEIQSGASLTINPGKALSVVGNLNNLGLLVIKSDVSGTGSLINSTIGVYAQVERFLTKMKWHFIGMPVTTGVAGVFDLPPGHADIYLKTHIESTNTWGPFIVSAETPLSQGRGYECWVGNPAIPGNQMDETVVFNGKLGAGDYTTGSGDFYTLEYTSGHGLNLICNPYPSALQANIDAWDKNNVANSVWIWSDSHGNYLYWGSGDNYGNGAFGT
ncbi:MAG: hypothetical protein FJY07_12285, partial [Bacteroidetes bacterium]|nr:hypothetical protein [Bacteroidota bacterium]